MTFHWTEAGNRSVRVLAAPFGFGPRTAAETLAHQLGLTLSDWKDSESMPVNDTCGTVLNFGVVQPGGHGGADFRIWIDPLMWLRASLPPEIRDYDLLLAEAFFPTRAFASGYGGRVMDVQPLYEVPRMGPRTDAAGHVLISCGGMLTPYSSRAQLCRAPAAFIRAIARAAQRHGRRRVICCLPHSLTADIAREVAIPDVTYASPTRAEFLTLLESADVYFVNPGLYGPFEAFELGRPVALTPPISYTQIGQALEFRRRGVVGDVPLLGEILASVEPLEFTFGIEQDNCFQRVAGWWEQVSLKPSTHEALEQWAATSLAGPDPTLGHLRRKMAEATRNLRRAGDVLTDMFKRVF